MSKNDGNTCRRRGYVYTFFMRKFFTSLYLFFSIHLALWASYATEEVCETRSGYQLYECRVESICENYKSEKPNYKVDDYPPGEDISLLAEELVQQTSELENARKLYRENMGNIYKCALIQSQRNSLSFLLDQIKQESSGQLSDSIGWQIQLRLNRLELSAGSIWCVLTEKEALQNKIEVLQEATHEICRYVNYLEYLKEYYALPEVAAVKLSERENGFPIREIPEAIFGIQREIGEEITHSYQVFPIAYQAYSEYESNIVIHFLLDIIKEDFRLVRTRFYEILMPIAQLGYKVINAMSF